MVKNTLRGYVADRGLLLNGGVDNALTDQEYNEFYTAFKKLSNDDADMTVSNLVDSGDYTTMYIEERLTKFALDDYITDKLVLAAILYNLTEPRKIDLYIIDLLDFYTLYRRPAKLMDLNTIYPKGFYTNFTIDQIYDLIELNGAIKHDYIIKEK